MTTSPTDVPRTTFDWRIYAEATCAGLTALLPLPFVDLVFESYFRRRMPKTIAGVRGMVIDPSACRRFGRGLGKLISADGCLRLPLAVVRYVLRKVWRKLVYVFAIADAASLVSAYWHRAYLLDHLISAGHAGSDVDWRRAAAVFEKVLDNADTGPLLGLARQTVSSTHRVARLLVRAKHHGAAEETESLSAILSSHWDAAQASLVRVAVRYNEEYESSLEVYPP